MAGGNTTTLLDCRWLDIGGAGRATELLLRGLYEIQPDGTWLLWGPPAVQSFVWPRAAWVRTETSPLAVWGQRSLIRMPRSDVAVYMHQIRPFRGGQSITLIHDTAPIRHGGGRVVRVIKRTFLRRVARLSSGIVTVSDQAKASITRDLLIDPSRIRVIRYPVDEGMAARVRKMRQTAPSTGVALYVGRFTRHKNLPRLIEAFGRTEFRRRGGRLRLVGGDTREMEALRDFARGRVVDCVDLQGPIPRTDLESLYASSRLLVLPSYEESYGLPAWEAASCGLPICVSTGGALPELYHDIAEFFSPTSVPEMAEAIDRAALRPVISRSLVKGGSVGEYASAFVEEIERLAAGLP